MSANPRKDLVRQRASFAYKEVKSWDKSIRVQATALAQELPLAVRTQGLLTTVAWLMRKNRSEHGSMARLMATWVLDTAPIRPLAGSKGSSSESIYPEKRLLEATLKADRIAYRSAQAETIALLEQVKLLSKALAERKEPSEGVPHTNPGGEDPSHG